MLLFLISLVAFIPQLHSISLEDYIRQNGMPQVINGSLNLSNKNLTDLTGLENIPNINQVQMLMLSGNQLQTLPAILFNGLNNLELLSLYNNRLQTLPDTIFNSLSNLKKLSLYNNRLQTLPATLFNGLYNLQDLDLNKNQLQTLPATIFNNLHNLIVLSLGDNKLKTLPDTIFNGLNNLQLLELRGNPFNPDFIPTLADMIRSIPNLEYLNTKPKDEALELYRIYNPKTLKELTADILLQKLEPEQLEQLEPHILDLLPLSQEVKAALAKKQAAQS